MTSQLIEENKIPEFGTCHQQCRTVTGTNTLITDNLYVDFNGIIHNCVSH